jgi:hypothetical protein
MGLFVNSLLPQACFCGEACLHGFQGTANDRQSIPFQNLVPIIEDVKDK